MTTLFNDWARKIAWCNHNLKLKTYENMQVLILLDERYTHQEARGLAPPDEEPFKIKGRLETLPLRSLCS